MLDAIAKFCLFSALLLGLVACLVLMIALIALEIYLIYCMVKVVCYGLAICISSLCGNVSDEDEEDKEDDEGNREDSHKDKRSTNYKIKVNVKKKDKEG